MAGEEQQYWVIMMHLMIRKSVVDVESAALFVKEKMISLCKEGCRKLQPVAFKLKIILWEIKANLSEQF